MPSAWLRRKVVQPWDGGRLRRAMYLATLVCPTSMPSLRREPRNDGLSTIEAAAMLERKPEIENALHASFERLLASYRKTRPISEARHRR